jgi:hypothetical protein
MKRGILLATLLICSLFTIKAQINFSANDFGRVPAYNGNFMYGVNMGYYGPSWDDKTLADIAAGNPAKNVKGVGSKSLHVPLPESFLEYWGYNVRVDVFNHYASLGIKDLTVFLEEPSNAHRDNTNYGCAQNSRLFKNMYSPIWDGGANGTPVNDTNYLALYLYKTVSTYKANVKFWEIINEPDLEYGSLGDLDPGQPGNWFDNNPPPCSLPNLYAPVFSYIRMLRVSYEVIKYVDPTAYVAPGGLGKPGFLDAILRNTDNPANGAVSSAYPLKGGAYFDALTLHSYPMYHLRQWDNNVFGFVHFRHSDAAVVEYINRKKKFDDVLAARGYNGTTYPAKYILITENGMPSKSMNNLIGSEEAQRNYAIKALVESQKNNIVQYYFFVLGDNTDPWAAYSELDVLGLYKKLDGAGPLGNGGVYKQQPHESGIAYKTTSDLLINKRYDAARTAALNLPSNVNGAAFKDAAGAYTYVLWAKTTQDLSETASATYNFPAGLVAAQLNKRLWDYSNTNATTTISSTGVALSGTPVFLTESGSAPPPPPPPAADCNAITITGGSGNIVLTGIAAPVATVQVFNSSWASIYNQTFTNSPGTVTVPSLTAGTYHVKATFYTAAWSLICDKFQGNVAVQSGTTPPPGGTPDCNNISIAPVSNGLKLSGLVAPVVTVQVFNSSWATVFNQAYSNSPNEVTVALAPGNYNVKVSFLTSSWGSICEKMQAATVGASAAANQRDYSVEKPEPMVSAKSMTVAPNPFVSAIQVTIGADKTENASLSIIDVSGRELYKKPIMLQKGVNRFTLDGSKYLPGSYFLKLTTANRVETIRLVRQ